MNKTKLISLVLALAAIPLSVDATIIKLPIIPASVSMYWPLIIAVASALHKWASTMQEKTTKSNDQAIR